MNNLRTTSLVLSGVFLLLGVAMALGGETTPGCILAGSALISLAIQLSAR